MYNHSVITLLSARYEHGPESVDVTEESREIGWRGYFYVGSGSGNPFPGKSKSLRVRYEVAGKTYEDLVPEGGMFVARPLRVEGMDAQCGDEFVVREAKFGANKYQDFTEQARSVFSNPFDYFRVTDFHGSNPFPDPEPGTFKYYVVEFVFKGRTFVSVLREPDVYMRLLEPIFSVIIPTWNRATLLRRCVGSVTGQDLLRDTRLAGLPDRSRVETVVIDDGSTDDTPEVMACICRDNPGLVYLRLPHTGCCGMVRNAGIRVSSGKFLAYLDSDDKYYPNHLSKVYDMFLRTDAMVVRTRNEFCRLKVMPDGSVRENFEIDFNYRFFNRWHIYTSCHAYRREVLRHFVPKEHPEQHWPMVGRNAGEDELFYIAMHSLGLRKETVEEPTVLYGLVFKGNNITYENPMIAAEYRDKDV